MSQAGKLPARSPRGFSPNDGTKAVSYTPPSVNELGMAIQLGQGRTMSGDSKLKGLIRGTMAPRMPQAPGRAPVGPASGPQARVELGQPDPNLPVVVRIVSVTPDGHEEFTEAEFPPGTKITSVHRVQ